MRRKNVLTLVLSTLMLAAPSLGRAQIAESLVRAPQLRPPEAASLAGAYAKTAFGAADVARGTFSLPGSFTLPVERAQTSIALTPSYSPENGLSEWGLGWSVRLEIRRFRVVGELGFDAADDLDTPWGRAVRGTDGTFYMQGLSSRTLIRESAGDLVASTEEGTHFTFARAQGIVSPRGTYQWNLVRVESVLGDVTTLSWDKNRFGRPFLRSVEYGARGLLPAQVQVRYQYEPVDTLLLDYRSEQMLRLTERVSSVEVRTRHAQRGTFEVRWYYALGYEQDPSGPAFYLTQVQRRFASGEQDPPFTYAYDHGFGAPESLVPVTTSVLDEALSKLGRTALMPQYASRFDANFDGVSELEHQTAQDELSFVDGALRVTALPRDGREDPYCRPARASTNTVRTLLQLRPEDDEPRVLHFLPRATQTEVRVCDRLGHLLEQSTLSGSFNLADPNLTLGDVNRDGRPDLVRAFGGGYQWILNESDAQGYRFRVLPVQRIQGSLSPSGAFARDMNGDGQVDIVLRHAGGLAVLYGQGNLSFDSLPFALTFRSAAGTPFSPSSYSFTFFDGNHDGLSDLVLTSGSVALLFGNTGREFVEQPAPALRTLATSGYPLVDDLTGSGELALYHIATNSVQSVLLTRPSSGLMTSAYDGKGNRLGFSYARQKSEPESYGSPVVLAEVTHESSGEDTVQHRYQLARPVLHPLTHALIGYQEVTHTEPLRSEFARLHHEPELSNVLLDHEQRAEGEPLYRFTHHDYETRTYQGIRHFRPVHEQTGMASNDGSVALSRESRTSAFASELCPSDVTETSSHGSIHKVLVPAQVARLSDAWPCLSERETWTGLGPDGVTQFEHAISLIHNELGQVTSIHALGKDEQVEVQTLTYGADHHLTSITEAGKGTSTFDYDPATGILRGVESSEAVHSGVSQFDPVTDTVAQMERDRGGEKFVADYRFDGRERLSSLWDSHTGGSQQNPSVRISYRDATSERPAVVARSQVLGDGQAQVQLAEYFSASGELIAKAVLGSDRREQENLIFSDAQFSARATGVRSLFKPAPLTGSASTLFDIGFADLRRGPEVETQKLSAFDTSLSLQRTVQQGIVQRLESRRELTREGILTTSTENGSFVQQVLEDVDGRVLSRTDQEGFITRMGYDSLGRLRTVTLASGDTQSVAYDELGRLASVQRSGLCETTYHYLFGTMLLEGKTVADGLGHVERTVLFQRDGAGRVFDELHTLSDSGEQERLRYEYDGQIDGSTRYAGQRGHLTRVLGPDFDKRFIYDPADRLVRSELHISGFRSLIESSSYYANGAERTHTTQVFDDTGELLETLNQTFHYDAHGRPTLHEVNGSPLLETRYGDRGEIERITGPGGTAYYHYDAVTQRERGVTYTTPASTTDVGWEFDARGHVASEDIGLGDAETRTRTYDYSARGFLTHVEDGAESEDYGYDKTGLRTSARDLRGAFSTLRTDGVVTLGDVRAEYDTLGRLSARSDAKGATTHYRYGARGQLAEAHVASATLSFAYDHENQRLLKKRNGRTVVAYVGNGYLDDEHFIVPVKVGSRVLGLLVDGTFEPVATDLRGTVVSAAGQSSVSSAYGMRSAHLAHAEVLDYAARGYDAELGFVRMGVRDYSPELGEFVTPDPLFMEAIERCASSPVECNLYGYAAGNPLLYVDPTGKAVYSVDDLKQEMEVAGDQLARKVDQAAYDARQTALSYLEHHLLASADMGGNVSINHTFSPLKGGPVSGTFELVATGKLVAGSQGMRFEGSVSVSGELEVADIYPAMPLLKGFANVQLEGAKVNIALKGLGHEFQLAGVTVSGGVRIDQGLGWEAAKIDGKVRAEVGLKGQISWDKSGAAYNLSIYAHARAECALGPIHKSQEVNAAVRLYDSRARN